MFYGVSYYPEHKTEEELQHDLKLLKESGINTVRMGEFAWCRLEPADGRFEFAWLDRVIQELGEAGISTVVCTPTACPPAWLTRKYPAVLYQDNRGVRRPFGGRRHYCYNNETYRRYCERIARQIGEHYGGNPFVTGFQIDNEPAQEGTGRCTCPVCRVKFQDWLRGRYGTIEEFNRRSGAVFWSQEYTDFGQIYPPVNTIEPGARNLIENYYENPALRLDFERFSSDSQISFQNIQADILKSMTTRPVTTNATGLATNSINYYKSTESLSCYAFDYYPELRDARVDSFPYAFARGVKGNQPFWLLEFMSGGGHRLGGSGRLQPNPGALKQAAVQAFAHGAQMLLHFQFRSFPIGAEQLNYAIVDLDGVPRRRYYEMRETAALLGRLRELERAEFPGEVGILFDYDTHWALQIKPVNGEVFQYTAFCGKLYRCLCRAGFQPDVIGYEGDFTGYKALVLPAGFVLGDGVRDKLTEFVEKGGVLIATFLTSVKNRDNMGRTEPLPAGLTEVFGVTVEEAEPVFKRNRARVEYCVEPGEDVYVTRDGAWSELLSGNARCIGRYAETYKEDSMVMSVHSYGAGKAWYVGTDPDEEAWHRIFEAACGPVCSFPGLRVPEGVEAVTRLLDGRRMFFLFNFSGREKRVTVMPGMMDYLTREAMGDEILLEENGFRILV